MLAPSQFLNVKVTYREIVFYTICSRNPYRIVLSVIHTHVKTKLNNSVATGSLKYFKSASYSSMVYQIWITTKRKGFCNVAMCRCAILICLVNLISERTAISLC
jgi:hypothetical protein